MPLRYAPFRTADFLLVVHIINIVQNNATQVNTELVCDRQIKLENRRSIRSADDYFNWTPAICAEAMG
jgi:hypothetical protein